MPLLRRIDTHQHIVPPFYARWLDRRNAKAGGLPIPDWSEDTSLALMEAVGIATAILSVSTPGVHFGDDGEARAVAREVNEYAAALARRHPRRFGFFATLPLPDVDGAIAEACHAIDVLGADGVVILANANGTYFGADEWNPLMAELDARRAVVFVHPTSLPNGSLPGVPPFAADFLLDTTRAAINYARSGSLERHPSLKIILSHGGGFVPYAAERIARICSADGQTPGGIARLRRFFFDTALTSGPYALPSLLAFADATRITFGSDWPHATRARALHFTGMLDTYPMTDELRAAIDAGNARTLFPRFVT